MVNTGDTYRWNVRNCVLDFVQDFVRLHFGETLEVKELSGESGSCHDVTVV